MVKVNVNALANLHSSQKMLIDQLLTAPAGASVKGWANILALALVVFCERRENEDTNYVGDRCGWTLQAVDFFKDPLAYINKKNIAFIHMQSYK